MNKIINLTDVKKQKKKELFRRKQKVLDSLEKLVEKIIRFEVNNESILVLEKMIEPCDTIYQCLNQIDKGRLK